MVEAKDGPAGCSACHRTARAPLTAGIEAAPTWAGGRRRSLRPQPAAGVSPRRLGRRRRIRDAASSLYIRRAVPSDALPTALLSDAASRPIALAGRIRPVWRGAGLAGPALTG